MSSTKEFINITTTLINPPNVEHAQEILQQVGGDFLYLIAREGIFRLALITEPVVSVETSTNHTHVSSEILLRGTDLSACMLIFLTEGITNATDEYSKYTFYGKVFGVAELADDNYFAPFLLRNSLGLPKRL